MKDVSESLTGRMGVLEMNSFSYRKITKSEYLPISFDELTLKDYIEKKLYKSISRKIYKRIKANRRYKHQEPVKY